MNRAAKSGVIVACAVALGLEGFGAYNIAHAQSRPSGGRRRTVTPAAESSTPPPAMEARTFARDFLKDWAAGPPTTRERQPRRTRRRARGRHWMPTTMG
ncbi:hypothetical protein [Streptomyces prunicolor]|uniref:hypothetical protein n=1 Tax=Streptomyces prunicolor TaxID=67348 RepID=UPI001FDFE8E0|nr:hypothetical protein [Streptomyces prunicolor]